MSASAHLSVRLQDIAQSLAEVLDEVAGEPIAFVLVLQADNAAQYVSNCDRKDGPGGMPLALRLNRQLCSTAAKEQTWLGATNLTATGP